MSEAAPASPDDARRIARALIGEDPTAEEAARWIDAVATVGSPLARPREKRLWDLARRGAPWLGFVDAALALVDPYSPVRHRVYLMLAVLEASPAHARRFEPHEAPAFVAALRLGARGVSGMIRTTIGLALLALTGTLAR